MATKLDVSKFKKVIKQYAAVSSKDWAQICNDKARDLALRAAQLTHKAKTSEIRATARRGWWPAYVMSIAGPGLSRAEYRAISKKLIGRRVSSANYMKSAFVKVGAKYPPGAARPGKERKPAALAGKFSGSSRGSRTLARVGRNRSTFKASWKDTKTLRSVRGKERIGIAGVKAARAFVVRDMEKYIKRKMRQRAKAASK